MPLCIECRYPVNQLYTTYSKADDRSLGKGVRLTQCPRCKRFADKYVEHDFVVLFIDLILIKPQVYRHLLFNRLGREDDRMDPSIIRISILLLLFDVYLTWARIEKASAAHAPTPPLLHRPIVLQYFFYLTLCTLSTLAFHLPIRALCALSAPSLLPPALLRLYTTYCPAPLRSLVPHYPHPATLSTALAVSSFTKLFPLLLLIWNYDLPSSAGAVSWAVIINNVAALEILLDCGYLRAGLLLVIGAAARGVVGWAMLRAVGLDGGAVVGVIAAGEGGWWKKVGEMVWL
ncbi:MAG: sterol homeostasis protein [Bathelium mastoideum]|nr:MAG: sterol homeostasis protein [Bathelium mastoideum]